jgi:hypothetical protein
MDCRQYEDRLLSAADVQAAAGMADAAAHAAQCQNCRRLAERVTALEQAWRTAPLPPAGVRAKQALLDRLATDVVLAKPGPQPRLAGSSRRRFLKWCASSAAAAATVGVGAWLLTSQQQASADEVLDRLIDWNLKLSESPAGTDRQRLYDTQGVQLRTLVTHTRLTGPQGVMAQDLLAEAHWLARHSDPVAGAERFDRLADRFLQTACEAATAGDQRRARRLMKQYNRLLEAGISANLERAERSGALDFEHPGRLEHFALGNPQRIQRLTALLEASPDASRAEIQQALRAHHKHVRRFPKRGKHPGPAASGAA